MPCYSHGMTFNVTTGSTVEFVVEFLSSAGVLTLSSGTPTLTVTYPPSSNSITTVSCAITMTLVGSFYTATWGSGVAALGLSSVSISAPGQQTPTRRTLRVIS
jgi:hypothetical protein